MSSTFAGPESSTTGRPPATEGPGSCTGRLVTRPRSSRSRCGRAWTPSVRSRGTIPRGPSTTPRTIAFSSSAAPRSSTTTSTEGKSGSHMTSGTQFHRVAVVSDVHANAPALAAVAEDVLAVKPDALVFGGDLTWGPLPEATWRLVKNLRERLRQPVFYVRGNAERALAELRA